MTRLQVVGLISFDRSSSTKGVIAHISGCIKFEACPINVGIQQRYHQDDDVLYLWTCFGSSYDRSVRDILALFLITHHIFLLLPSSLDVEHLRLLRHLQQLRSSLSIPHGPPSISFVISLPPMLSDNLGLRFRAQTESTIRSLITPICSNPPLFQTPIQKPALIFPTSLEPNQSRHHTQQLKRFRQVSQTIVLSVRSRYSSIPLDVQDWRMYADKLLETISSLPMIVSPVANNLRLLWDELLPGFADTVIRLYNESCSNGIYGDDIHQSNAQKSLKQIRGNLPSHVYNQLEPVLLNQLEAIWTRSGRRKCSAISVTGRSCIHLFHQTDDSAPLPASFGDIPRKRHSSGFLAVHSCNCGSVQVNVPDPFDLAEIQSDILIQRCCQSSLMKTPFFLWRIHIPSREIDLKLCSQWYITQDEYIMVAFELECESGHRFFHNFRDPVAKFVASTSPVIVRESFPPTDIPVMLKCHECQNISTNASARLRRLFVDTTHTSCAVHFRPGVFVRCKRPDYHLKTTEDRSEINDFIQASIVDGITSCELPSKTLVAVTIPLGFPSSLGNNRAFRTEYQFEIVINQGILFARPDSNRT